MPNSAPNLLLIPTDLERDRVRDLGGFEAAGEPLVQATCGFGVIAAAARTMQLIARHAPRRVLLMGIAGSFDEAEFEIGTARAFGAVEIDGIGVGEGAGFRGPNRLGFSQWPGPGDGDAPPALDEHLELATGSGLLLTTCAASDSPSQAAERRGRHPDAIAEDMEGFAVASACRLARVPVAIVRGASNLVGVRDPKHWRIPLALSAARRLAIEFLERDDWGDAP
ncbi:MAG TPA: futalosine hydrolase [Planctomycetes bacterium]|nr:futalosine hydrolase [Planctomycetota bacterium]